MPRGNQLIRQWRLLRALEASRRGQTVAELHEQVAELASSRTVYRDLQTLEEAGFPLYQHDGRWRILDTSEGGTTLPVQPTEMMALLLSEQVMAPLRGSELAEPLVRLRAKLMTMLGPKGREYVDQLSDRFVATLAAPGQYEGRRDALERIERAIRTRRRIEIVHFTAHRGETLTRQVSPYGIWYADGALYLIGHDHLRDDVRKYLVDRIQRIEVLDAPFEPDPDFNLQHYVGTGFRVWHGAIHRVVVRFAPQLAHLPRERRFHRSQRIKDLDDGSVRVTFEAAGVPDLASWVCSFGGLVVAQEPPELVAMVREMLGRAADAHGGGMSSGDLSLDDNGG